MDYLVRDGSSFALEAVTGGEDWVDIIFPTQTDLGGGVASYYTHHLTTAFAKVEIKSLTATAAPEFPIDATPSERLRIIQEHEWVNGTRYELEIGIHKDGMSDPVPIFRASCMRQLGAPFYTINLMAGLGSAGDFIIGETDKLTARVVSAGYGSPQSQDSVIIYGCEVREAWKLPDVINTVSQTNTQTITLATGELFSLPARYNRKGLKIATWTNDSFVQVTESTTISDPGFPLLGTGSYYEMNSSRMWTGSVFITAMNDSTITLQEDW